MSRAGAGTCPAHPAGLPVDTLAHQALHDPLTDLSNRTLFMDRLSQALARSERHGSLVAVLFLDLDHFKVHQRQPGARRGKRAARQDGGAAPRRPASRGTASRFGGDEFVILLEDIDGEGQVVDMAHRLARAVAEPIELEAGDVVVTTSVGIAIAHGIADSPDAVVRDADAAVYRAKEHGRARCELFDNEMRRRADQ